MLSVTSPLPIPTRADSVLARSWGGTFRNTIYKATFAATEAGPKLSFNDTRKVTTIGEMMALRSSGAFAGADPRTVTQRLQLGETVSNLGVSAALSCTLAGKEFAVLALRKPNRLMLISGYLDAAREQLSGDTGRAQVVGGALKEAGEELLVVNRRGRIATGAVMLRDQLQFKIARELRLLEPQAELSNSSLATASLPVPYALSAGAFANRSRFTLEFAALPPYLLGVNPECRVEIDGSALPGGVHIDQPRGSAQIVLSYRLRLPAGRKLSLFHAETQLDPEMDQRTGRKGHIKEVLIPDGIVLAELGSGGNLSGKLFRLRRGALSQLSEPASQFMLSEVFSPSANPGGFGLTTVSEIPFQQYLEAARQHRRSSR